MAPTQSLRHTHRDQRPGARLTPARSTSNVHNKAAGSGPTLSGAFGHLALAVFISALLVCRTGHTSALAGDSALGADRHQLATRDTKTELESELNALMQQHELGPDANSKLLSEAIISRLMLGNISDVAGSLSESIDSLDEAADLNGPGQEAAPAAGEPEVGPIPNGPEALRLRKMLSYLQNYEMAQAAAGLNGGQAFSQYPVLPASPAATIKRASVKMGNFLRQQQHQPHAGQRQPNGYGRVNSFDFGLGKRPDASVAGNVLRFGDSATAGAHLAAITGSGLGKRPAAHRYDFGLSKRVASPAYPRYDFGLGKRAPSRIRYDFGLGK